MKKYIQVNIIFCALALLISLVSCAKQQSANTAEQKEITIAAAANLTDAFEEVGREFTKDTGIKTIFSYGATADLAKQIENGAPFDVFAAADVANVDRLDKQSLLTAETKKLYARGRLVLLIPTSSKAQVNRIEDLTKEDVTRVAVAKPDVAPYGKAAVESLTALNIWKQVEPKVVYGQNVSQVKQYATTGNVDVAFLPLSLVKPNDGRYIEVDEKLHQPIDQAIGVVKASAKQESAKRFVEFLMSEKGQTILSRFGYSKP